MLGRGGEADTVAVASTQIFRFGNAEAADRLEESIETRGEVGRVRSSDGSEDAVNGRVVRDLDTLTLGLDVTRRSPFFGLRR